MDLTFAALDFIREKLGIQAAVGIAAWSPEIGDVSEDCLKAVLTSYLETELRGEGATFWDPLTEQGREMDRPSVLVLLGESTAFRDLRVAIHDAFTEPLANRFVTGLRQQDIDILDFDRVLPELSNLFGGPFAPGDRFLTSSTELYSRLRAAEQSLLRCYYRQMVSEVRS